MQRLGSHFFVAEEDKREMVQLDWGGLRPPVDQKPPRTGVLGLARVGKTCAAGELGCGETGGGQKESEAKSEGPHDASGCLKCCCVLGTKRWEMVRFL